MEKLKRTFRLSEQAVEAIENRNRKLYPTATDFLEAKILAPADNSTEMLHKISAQLKEKATNKRNGKSSCSTVS